MVIIFRRAPDAQQCLRMFGVRPAGGGGLASTPAPFQGFGTPASARATPAPGALGRSLEESGQAAGPGYRAEVPVVERGRGEERRRQLTVTIDSPLVQGSKRVSLVLTDQQDHFFYYSLLLLEEDFHNLKQQQGLLVDFSGFPSMLVQLVEKCQAEGRTDHPKFQLVLNCTSGQVTLDFTELAQFKHLVHLSLVVLKATDTQLKDYLVESLTGLGREREAAVGELQRRAAQLEAELEAARSQLHAKATELEQYSELSASLGQRLAREVAAEKERAVTGVQELQQRQEQERREAEAKHARSLQQLENRVASLDVQNRDLVEVRYRQEASLREARAKAAGQEEELGRLRGEAATQRQERAGLESGRGERERAVGQLGSRVAALEQEVAERTGEARRGEEAARRAEEARERAAREAEEKGRLVERREKAVRTVTEELMKANEIISKLQAEVKAQQGKVRLRSSIAGEQERLLGERDRQLAETREEARTAAARADTLAGEQREAAVRLAEHQAKVEELEKLLETKENVMNWLNKQLQPGQAAERGVGAGRRGGAGAGRAVRAAAPRGRAARPSPSDPASNGTVTQQLRETGLEAGMDKVGLDPKYFERSTPGGTQWRTEIPRDLPSNLRPGRGLLRQQQD